MVKKIVKILLLIIFFCSISNVYAKERSFTCRYSIPATENSTEEVGLNMTSSQAIGVRCDIYDDFSHICWIKKDSEIADSNDNEVKIRNWTNEYNINWNAKEYIQNNNACPKFIVAKIDGVLAYEIFSTSTTTDVKNLTDWVNASEGPAKRYLLTNTSVDYNREINNGQRPGEEENESGTTENSGESNDPYYGSIKDIDLENICNKPSFRKPLKVIGEIVRVIKILVPVIIIVFGIFDLYKAITSSKDGAIKSSATSIIIRLVAGIAIFLLPGIVQFILNMVNEYSDYENTWCCCTQCILDVKNCDVNSCSSNSCKIGGMNS